jgi:hypothetical protein
MAARVLIVSPFADDFLAVEPIVTNGVRTLREAIEFVATNPVAVVDMRAHTSGWYVV